jgi:pimeloyl-ACP methyl ester carboxylesterase
MIPAALRLSRHYRELRQSTVILAGGDDRHVGTEAQSVRLHDLLPRSELEILPGVGHMVQHTAPLAVMAALDRAAALAGTPQPGGGELDLGATKGHMTLAA